MIINWGGKATIRARVSSYANGSIGYERAFNDVGFPIVALSSQRKGIWIRLLNRYGDLQMVFDEQVTASWEYNRNGGCGQCEIRLSTTMSDTLIGLIGPESSIQIYINRELRYWGKIIRISRSLASGSDQITFTTFGYSIELDTLIVAATYTGWGIGAIVRDIMTTYVTPYSNLTYSSSNVDDTDYAVSELVLNHTVKDAMLLLASLGGQIEWGVDRNRSFYFKTVDTNVKRAYVLGREITNYQEERRDDSIINYLNIYGGTDNAFIALVQSTSSISKYGRKSANVFESSISTVQDANRLGLVKLKASTLIQRSVKFSIIKEDEFIETSVPLGAVAITKSRFNARTKYGHNEKDVRNIKYGNLRREQFGNIHYEFINGGLNINADISSDIPNLGDLTKEIEINLKDVQRR